MSLFSSPVFLIALIVALCASACASGARKALPVEPTVARIHPDREPAGTVLFLLSSEHTQILRSGQARETGTFLNEFYEPYLAVLKDGYQVVIATPDGAVPAVDPEGMKPKYWDNEQTRDAALALLESSLEFKRPLNLHQALEKSERWSALIVPGGQGVMIDIVPNPSAHRLVLELARRNVPIGLICHAPALLTHLPREENPLLGRTVTSVSPFEEFYIETFVMKGRARERKIGQKLRGAGYDYDSALPKANYAVSDGNLVTSQNPFSGKSFVRQFHKVLDESRRGVLCRADGLRVSSPSTTEEGMRGVCRAER